MGDDWVWSETCFSSEEDDEGERCSGPKDDDDDGDGAAAPVATVRVVDFADGSGSGVVAVVCATTGSR